NGSWEPSRFVEAYWEQELLAMRDGGPLSSYGGGSGRGAFFLTVGLNAHSRCCSADPVSHRWINLKDIDPEGAGLRVTWFRVPATVTANVEYVQLIMSVLCCNA